MKIELEGYNLNELIKTLHRKKIQLANILKTDATHMSFEVRDADSKRINRFIANYKIKKTLTKVKLIPKLALANLGIIIGLFFGILFAMATNNYPNKK